MIEYNEAIQIAEKFSQELSEKYKNMITAVFVIGSLGSDYYRPGQSDIDTAIITKYSRSEINYIKTEISSIANKYWKEYNVPKGFGTIAFAEEQLFPPYIKKEELILEILRLKTQSKKIYGNYETKKIPYPDKQAIIDDAKSFQEWVDDEKKKSDTERHFSILLKMDFVSLVNSMLIALKRYLLIKCEIAEFNKFKVLKLYLKNNPPIVNDEAFLFIEESLNNNEMQIDYDKLARITAFHDNLYSMINKLVFCS